MKLEAKIEITKEYQGKSKFEFWKNLKVGHILRVIMELKNPGRGRNGLYSPDVLVYNTNTGESFKGKMGDMTNYLSKAEYKNYEPKIGFPM